VKVGFLYNKKVLKAILELFTELMNNKNLPPDYDFLITIASFASKFHIVDRIKEWIKSKPELHTMSASLTGVILFEGLYSNVKGKDGNYDDSWFKKFIDIEGIKLIFVDHQMPLSKLMVEFIVDKQREFDLPYKKTLRGSTKAWKKEFIDSYCDKVDTIFVNRGEFQFVSQLQLGGGAYYTNDPYSQVTAIAHRDIVVGFTFDIFYDTKIDQDAEHKAVEFQLECEKEWIQNKLFSDDDIRMTWGTFGDTNIKNVFLYYYGPNAMGRFAALRRIKKYFDPKNVYHNRFSIPID